MPKPVLADLRNLGILYIFPFEDRCKSGEPEPLWPLLSVDKGAPILACLISRHPEYSYIHFQTVLIPVKGIGESTSESEVAEVNVNS